MLKFKRLLIIAFVLSAMIILNACDSPTIEAQYAAAGSYKTTQDTIPGFVLHYPQQLRRYHPIITWGNGTGGSPEGYAELLSHLASWGFVVIASDSPNTGQGTEMLEGVDYLIQQNRTRGSIFYRRLNVAKIGATGHSQGGIGATRAALDPRITCSAPIAGGLTTYRVPNPIMLIAGAKDIIVPLANVQRSFMLATAPAIFAVAQNMAHRDFDHDCGDCRGYLTAWFMYLLQDDATAAQAFVGDCEICTNSNWEIEIKNFDDMPVPE